MNIAGRSVLVPTFSNKPVMIGTGDGVRLCPHCDTVLAEGIVPDTIWNVTIQCAACEKLGAFPDLPKGAAIGGGGAYMALNVGRYGLSDQLKVANVVIIGAGHQPQGGGGKPLPLQPLLS